MIALYIILGIVAAITLLFCVKISVELRYEDDFNVFVKVLFIKIRLLPAKEKKPKKEKPPKEEKEEEKKEEPEKEKEEKPKGESLIMRFYHEQGFDGTMQFLADVLAALNTLLGDFFKRSFVLEKLMLRLRVSKGDAAETALAFGKTCAAVYPALGYICTNLRVRQYDADVQADYLAQQSSAAVWFILSIRPIKLTNALVRFVFRGVVAFLKTRIRARKRKKELSIERTGES
ncbi:MAG: hypothetical protein IJT44_01135 [Clostridia bacterium]|nr:hypothetical protein [Clostridia bacterium]